MKKKILCIGDVLLDRYVFGSVKKISPEAPVPIFSYLNTLNKLGGAANVALNCKNLNMDITLIGGVGIDDNGRKIKNLLEKYNIKSTLVKDKSYRTILKTRYLSDSKQLMRVDEDNFIFKNNRLKYIKKTIDHFDIVIVSDYGKGFIDSLGKNFLYSISKFL